MYVDTLSSTTTWCFSIATKEFSIATSKRVFSVAKPPKMTKNIPPLTSSHDPQKHGIL